MSEDIDSDLIVNEGKKFAAQFRHLLWAADKLGELGDLRRAEHEAQQAVKRVQGELAVLQGERDREYQHIYDAIEAELKFKYSESEKLLADQAILRTSVKGLEDRRAELQAKLADLERRIGQAEGRYGDITGKLGALRTSLDR
jgi:chromosome segregation ATPase